MRLRTTSGVSPVPESAREAQGQRARRVHAARVELEARRCGGVRAGARREREPLVRRQRGERGARADLGERARTTSDEGSGSVTARLSARSARAASASSTSGSRATQGVFCRCAARSPAGSDVARGPRGASAAAVRTSSSVGAPSVRALARALREVDEGRRRGAASSAADSACVSEVAAALSAQRLLRRNWRLEWICAGLDAERARPPRSRCARPGARCRGARRAADRGPPVRGDDGSPRSRWRVRSARAPSRRASPAWARPRRWRQADRAAPRRASCRAASRCARRARAPASTVVLMPAATRRSTVLASIPVSGSSRTKRGRAKPGTSTGPVLDLEARAELVGEPDDLARNLRADAAHDRELVARQEHELSDRRYARTVERVARARRERQRVDGRLGAHLVEGDGGGAVVGLGRRRERAAPTPGASPRRW